MNWADSDWRTAAGTSKLRDLGIQKVPVLPPRQFDQSPSWAVPGGFTGNVSGRKKRGGEMVLQVLRACGLRSGWGWHLGFGHPELGFLCILCISLSLEVAEKACLVWLLWELNFGLNFCNMLNIFLPWQCYVCPLGLFSHSRILPCLTILPFSKDNLQIFKNLVKDKHISRSEGLIW